MICKNIKKSLLLTLGLVLSVVMLASNKTALIHFKISSDLKKVVLLKHVNGDKEVFQQNLVVNDDVHMAISLQEAGYYFLALSPMVKYPIYLKPGDELSYTILKDRVELNDVDPVNAYLANFFKKRMDLLMEFLGNELDYNDLLNKINEFEADQQELLKPLKNSNTEFYDIQSLYIKAIAAEYRMRPIVMPNNLLHARDQNKAFWTEEFNKINLNNHPIADLPNGMMLTGVYEGFAQFVVGADKSFETTLNQFTDPHVKSMIVMNRMSRFRIYDKRAQDYIEKHRSYISDEHMQKVEQWKAKFETILPGKDVPDFEFLNSQKEVVKLSAYKGKWVYIDLWASWCGPCKQETPHFAALADEYKEAPIAFLAVSLDNDLNRWAKQMSKKEAGNVYNLFTEGEFDSAIADFFKVTGIPRFILLDPEGRIVENNMNRPSDPATKKVLDQLLSS